VDASGVPLDGEGLEVASEALEGDSLDVSFDASNDGALPGVRDVSASVPFGATAPFSTGVTSRSSGFDRCDAK
jgi:hypothetical protein